MKACQVNIYIYVLLTQTMDHITYTKKKKIIVHYKARG